MFLEVWEGFKLAVFESLLEVSKINLGELGESLLELLDVYVFQDIDALVNFAHQFLLITFDVHIACPLLEQLNHCLISLTEFYIQGFVRHWQRK